MTPTPIAERPIIYDVDRKGPPEDRTPWIIVIFSLIGSFVPPGWKGVLGYLALACVAFAAFFAGVIGMLSAVFGLA